MSGKGRDFKGVDIKVVRERISSNHDSGVEKFENKLEEAFNKGYRAIDIGCTSQGSNVMCVGVFRKKVKK